MKQSVCVYIYIQSADLR